MRDIQHLLKVEVEFEVADGFEPEIAFHSKTKISRSCESMEDQTLVVTPVVEEMSVQNSALPNR